MHHVVLCLASFFQLVVFLLLEPLRVDFELTAGPSHLQKPSFDVGKTYMLDGTWFWDIKLLLRALWGPSGLFLGGLGRTLAALSLSPGHKGEEEGGQQGRQGPRFFFFF